MSREILEEAFRKSRKEEERQLAKAKIMETLGRVVGTTIAIMIDGTVVWMVLKFMIGLQVGWVAVLGGMFLLNLLVLKIKS